MYTCNFLFQIKTKPQGVIPLSGSALSLITEEIVPVVPGRPKRHSLPPQLRTQTNNTICNKPHMFCIETEDHKRYIIQVYTGIYKHKINFRYTHAK